ncbi:hypothetical protein, partial [Bifidobacterium catenulatum]|uniref:hypothetical protein n=1 Tax=Bifidobacterium catenulatum TaxID=1686 RepID=UPI0023EBFED2
LQDNASTGVSKTPLNGRKTGPEPEDNDHTNQKQTPHGVSPPHKEHMRNPTPLYEGKNRLGRTGSDIRNGIHVEIQRGPPTGEVDSPRCISVVIQLLMLTH